MGIFDKISKAVKIAQDILDDGKLNGSADGKTVSTPKTTASSQAVKSKPVRTTPVNVLNSGNTPIGELREVKNLYAEVVSSFMLPTSFTEFDSHAEPEMCHSYMFDDNDLRNGVDLSKPYICITPENFAYHAVESFLKTGKPVGVSKFEAADGSSKMLFKAWLDDYHGQTLCFYGFERGEGNHDYMGLTMIYCKDVIGTPLEKKLEQILDTAAKSYKETTKN